MSATFVGHHHHHPSLPNGLSMAQKDPLSSSPFRSVPWQGHFSNHPAYAIQQNLGSGPPAAPPHLPPHQPPPPGSSAAPVPQPPRTLGMPTPPGGNPSHQGLPRSFARPSPPHHAAAGPAPPGPSTLPSSSSSSTATSAGHPFAPSTTTTTQGSPASDILVGSFFYEWLLARGLLETASQFVLEYCSQPGIEVGATEMPWLVQERLDFEKHNPFWNSVAAGGGTGGKGKQQIVDGKEKNNDKRKSSSSSDQNTTTPESNGNGGGAAAAGGGGSSNSVNRSPLTFPSPLSDITTPSLYASPQTGPKRQYRLPAPKPILPPGFTQRSAFFLQEWLSLFINISKASPSVNGKPHSGSSSGGGGGGSSSSSAPPPSSCGTQDFIVQADRARRLRLNNSGYVAPPPPYGASQPPPPQGPQHGPPPPPPPPPQAPVQQDPRSRQGSFGHVAVGNPPPPPPPPPPPNGLPPNGPPPPFPPPLHQYPDPHSHEYQQRHDALKGNAGVWSDPNAAQKALRGSSPPSSNSTGYVISPTNSALPQPPPPATQPSISTPTGTGTGNKRGRSDEGDESPAKKGKANDGRSEDVKTEPFFSESPVSISSVAAPAPTTNWPSNEPVTAAAASPRLQKQGSTSRRIKSKKNDVGGGSHKDGPPPPSSREPETKSTAEVKTENQNPRADIFPTTPSLACDMQDPNTIDWENLILPALHQPFDNSFWNGDTYLNNGSEGLNLPPIGSDFGTHLDAFLS